MSMIGPTYFNPYYTCHFKAIEEVRYVCTDYVNQIYRLPVVCLHTLIKWQFTFTIYLSRHKA